MAQPSDPYNLVQSWRALSGNADGEGWRTIPLDINGNCILMAGRYYPDDAEAILIGFNSVTVPANKFLPQGQGFKVEKIKSSIAPGNRVWVALSRLPSGSIDMFTVMAQDIVQAVHKNVQQAENNIFQVFLGRIQAWQNFMDKASISVLGAEAEIGLFGELIILRKILEKETLPALAIDAWMGPLSGVHDFILGNGGIEIKTTVSENSFQVKIGSLEQLDNTLVRPLYLAAVRLALADTGVTLPEFIQETRHCFESDPVALNIYDCRLIQAGFLAAFSDRYTRRFSHIKTELYEITETFPRLTRDNVPPEITKANYELDLTMVNGRPSDINEALEELRGK